MPTDTAQRPDIQERVAMLKSQIDAVQGELQTILQSARHLQVLLPELHEPSSGRIDAERLAAYMGIPLKRLAEGLQLNYKSLHRNPSAGAFQAQLAPVKRSLEVLHEFFIKPETVRVWLNTPHPAPEGRTALDVILSNNPNAVLRILENAAAGVPV